jgi:hypothetical protein
MSKVDQLCRTLTAGTLLLLLQGAASAETKVEGTPDALRIETSDSPIQEVLASLRDAFSLEYRTSVQLDQQISGTYQGSLQRVLARVLDGYDFILKNSSEKIELMVLSRKGSPATQPVNSDPTPPTAVELASGKPATDPNSAQGKSDAAKAAAAQKAQQSTVPLMLTALAEQQLPNAGGSSPRSTPAASGPSSGGTVPTQAEIAALTQQAATKLEALRSSLQRVGR